MRKRLRKKRRLGEFREHCFDVTFRFDPSLSPQAVDDLTDDFIEMIERNELQFGGGGGSHEWSGIVEGLWRVTATEKDQRTVLEWLRGNENVIDASVGPLKDAWNE